MPVTVVTPTLRLFLAPLREPGLPLSFLEEGRWLVMLSSMVECRGWPWLAAVVDGWSFWFYKLWDFTCDELISRMP